MKCLHILLMLFIFIMSTDNAEAQRRYRPKYARPYLHRGGALETSKGYGIKFHWGTAIIERGVIKSRRKKLRSSVWYSLYDR